MNKTISPAFVCAIPKTDLHLHLDGSLRIPTLIELAKEHRVKVHVVQRGGIAAAGIQGHVREPARVPERICLYVRGDANRREPGTYCL